MVVFHTIVIFAGTLILTVLLQRLTGGNTLFRLPRRGVAGAITTAIVCPWDVAPASLVLKTGCTARAFSRSDHGGWTAHDPLDFSSYDFLITGNSQETVDILSEILTAL